MRLVDPHLDVASIYDEMDFTLDDFYSRRIDVPVTLPMLIGAEVGLAGFTLFMDPNLVKTSMYDGVMKYYDFYQKLLSRTDKLRLVRNGSELESIKIDEVGFFYSLEGLECIRDFSDLEQFYSLGVRSFGLSWEPANKYATGNGSKIDYGITNQGKFLLKEMSKKRLIVDTAHLSDQSFKDLDRSFDGVIINSHANSRKIVNMPHNLTDDQIQMIVDHEGLVCIFPIKDEVGGEGTFDDWYKHLDYIASKWGIERVGLCSDIFPLPEYPFVNDAQNMTVIKDFQKFLLDKLDPKTVQRISHDNFYEIFKKSL